MRSAFGRATLAWDADVVSPGSPPQTSETFVTKAVFARSARRTSSPGPCRSLVFRSFQATHGSSIDGTDSAGEGRLSPLRGPPRQPSLFGRRPRGDSLRTGQVYTRRIGCCTLSSGQQKLPLGTQLWSDALMQSGHPSRRARVWRRRAHSDLIASTNACRGAYTHAEMLSAAPARRSAFARPPTYIDSDMLT